MRKLYPAVQSCRLFAIPILAAFFMLLSVRTSAQNVTVNPGAGSYATLKAAFDAINAGTHTGAVTITISANTTETVSAVLNASGTGSASYTSVTISPSGARTVSGAITAGSPLIDLSGADNVTIDGLNTGGNSLIISNTTNSATSGTSTIRLINGATGNTITNCSVLGSFNASATTNGGNIYFATDASTANGNDNNTVSNCKIGPAGSNLPTKGIYGNGTTTTTAIGNSNITITNNEIYDYFGAAVTSAGIYAGSGNTDWTISNNKFYQSATRTQTTSGQHSAIWIVNTSGNNFSITGNTIGFSSAAGTGMYTVVGTTSTRWIMIYLSVGSTTASSIQGNTIKNISVSGSTSGTTTSAAFRAMYIAGGLTNVGNVSGNTIGDMSSTGSITYTSSSASSSDIIGIYNNGSDNWICNNNLIGGFTLSSSGTGAAKFFGFYVSTLSSVTTSFLNNTIGGSVANSIQSTSSSTSSQVTGIYISSSLATVTGNLIRNLSAAGGTGTTTSASVAGIVAATSTSLNHTVSSNTIHSLENTNGSAATTVTGIQYTASSGTNLVSKNFIHSLKVASTAGIINGIQISGGTTTYANNMIRLGVDAAGGSISTSALVTGINEIGGTNNIYYNSVYVGGSGVTGTVSSYAFNSTVTTNTRNYRNNIFFNARSNGGGGTGKHYAVKVAGTAANPTGLTSNNNLFFVNGTGGVFGFFNSLDVANMSAWRTAVGQDAASVTGDPQFLLPTGTSSTVDLHINTAVATQLESSAAVLAAVTDDFDGNTRDASTPDVGADEGNFIQSDVSGPVISFTNLVNLACIANRTITATITDASNVETAAGTKPRIYFRRSTDANTYNDNTSGTDGWKYTEATNSSSPFSFTIDHSLLNGGTGVAAGQTVEYFIVAQDQAAVVNVSIKNGSFTVTPATVALDATAFPVTGTSSYNVVAGIAASVTIGAAGTYTSLTGAAGLFQAINNTAVSANTTVEISDASISETGAVALNNIVYGCGGPFTLTIKPGAGVTSTLSGTLASNGLIRLSGADYVIIDGSNNGSTSRNLTITNTATTTPTAILISSLGTGEGATNNTIKNTNISTSATSTSYGISAGGATHATTGADNDDLTLQNNNISGVSTGIYALGTAAVSAGGLDNLVVSGNIITVNTTTATAYGIRAGGALNATISANELDILTSGGGEPTAISLETNFLNSSVSKNLIKRAYTTSTSTVAGRGITIGTGTASSNLTVVNNVIYGVGGATNDVSFGSSSAMGIAIGVIGASSTLTTTAGGISLLHNSINLYGSHSHTSATITAGIYVGSNASALDIRNNSIVNSLDNTTTAGSINYGIYSAAAASAFSTLDNNLYYGVSSANSSFVVGYLTADQATIAAWRTATGKDAASINVDPLYNSNTILTPGFGSPLLNAGTPIGSVTTDFNGAARSLATPTIGAYEVAQDIAGPVITFSALSNTVCATNRNISATITDPSAVNITAGTKPRIWFRKSTNANVLPGTNDNTTDGWKYTEATNSTSPFNFTIDYSLISGGIAGGDIIQYFFSAQDQAAGVNVTTSPAVVTGTATTAALAPGNFPVSGFNTYTLVAGGLGTDVTIGAAGTYTSLTGTGGLFEAINSGGLTANVTATIIDATVTENGATALNNIVYGCDGTYNLTIKPAAGVNATLSGSSTGAIIKLNGADNVVIDGSNDGTNSRNLTIKNTNTGTSSAVVWMASASASDGATGNTIKNCIITGNSRTTTLFGIFSGGSTISNTGVASARNNGNVFQNNDINTTQYGIYSAGVSTGARNSGTVITQNLMNGSGTASQDVGGILVRNEDGVSISGNTIANVGGTSGSKFGISLAASSFNTTSPGTSNEVINATISGNIISGVTTTGGSSAFGILVSPATTGTTQVMNNAVSGVNGNATASDFIAGIYIGGGTGSTTNVYFNSVSMSGTGTRSYPSIALAIGGTDPIVNVKDNILYNSSTTTGSTYSYAFVTADDAFSNLSFNYNLLYVTGLNAVLGGTGSISSPSQALTLASLNSTIGGGANSLNVDPLFNSGSLVPQPGSPAINAGTPVAGVTTDLLGALRNVTTPTMGAYEQAVDGSGPTITYTAISNMLCVTAPSLTATITDPSGVNITSGTKPRIWFKKSTNANVLPATNDNTTDGWKYAEATNASSPFTFNIDYSLISGGVAAGNTIQYFVTAQDLSGTPYASINAGTVTGTLTTAAMVSGNFPVSGTNSYSLGTGGLSADVTIGAAGTYPTLTGTGGLFEAINNSGITANISATILDAAITETGTVSLNAINYGCNGPFTLTIKPATGVTTVLSGSASPLINLNGADNVVVDGSNNGTTSRDMTVRNSSTTGPVFRLIADATLNTIKNTVIESGNTSSSSAAILFSTGTSSGNSNNTISNNVIRDRTDATVSAEAVAINSVGSSGAPNASNTIDGNHLQNFTSSGINLASPGTGNNWQISSNHFFNNLATNPTTTQTGIIINAGTGHSITGNYIGGNAANATGTWTNTGNVVITGISLSNGSATVSNNTIANISGTSTGTTTRTRGIHVGSGYTGNTVNNNTIRDLLSTGGVTGYDAGNQVAVGIYVWPSVAYQPITVSGNTIYNITGANTTALTSTNVVAGMFVTNYGGSVYNNTVYGIKNLSTGTTAGQPPVATAVYARFISNGYLYNNFLSAGFGQTDNVQYSGILLVGGGANQAYYYNNSIRIGGTANGSFSSYGVIRGDHTTTTPGHKATVINNVISMERTGGTALNYAIANQGTTASTNWSSNYNDLYNVVPANIGYWNATGYNFADWKTTSANDANSVSVAPSFASETNLHLSTDNNCALNGAGTSLAQVTTDIDGEARHGTTPDIGADEFNSTFTLTITNPASVCTGTSVDLTAAAVTAGSTTGGTLTYWTDAGATAALGSPAAVSTSGTYYIKLEKGSCTSIQPVVVTIDPVTVAGTVSGAQAVCTGSQPGTDLVLNGNTGTVVKWQKSSDAGFTSPTDISSTSTTLTGAAIGTLTATTYFRAVVQSGACAVENSSSVLITVNPNSVGGSVAGAQTICTGTQPGTDLVLSGNTGSVVKWQKSSDAAFTSPVDITSTALTLTGAEIGNLAADTYFRAVVQSGSCASANSAAVLVTVSPTTVAGTVTGAQTICTGTQPADLVLGGNTGAVVKWQKSSDAAFTTPTDIASTATTLTGAVIGSLSSNTYFRAVVQSGACAPANTAAVLISIDAASVGGTVAGAQTVCSGSQPSTDLVLSGNTGNVVKWQKSTDAAFTSPTDISSTSATLTGAVIGNLSVSTYFRAVVKNGACTEANSASVLITVNTSGGGTLAGDQTICSGTQPATDLVLTGNSGAVLKWQKSADAGFTSPVDIASTATTLTGAAIGNLTASTYFRAVVQSGSCASVNSNSILVTVTPLAVGGTVAGTQSVCTGSAPSTDLVLSGNVGTVVKWQKSTDAAFTSPVDIASTATTLTGATIGNLSQNTYFRAVVQSGSCGTANSASVLVSVDAATVAGTVSGTQTICSGTQPGTDLVLSGHNGTVVKWQKSTDAAFTSPVDIASTATTLTGATIGTLSQSTYLRAVIQNGSCASANSAAVLVTVEAATVAGSVSGTQTVCIGNAPSTSLVLSGNTGTVVKWQKSTDAAFTSPVDIASTATTLTGATIGTLTQTTWFRAVVQSGGCGAANSASVTITVNSTIDNTTSLAGTAGGAQVCASYDVAASNNYLNNCNAIASIVPGGASPVSGNISVCLQIDGTVQTASTSEPYVQRHFNVTPAVNPATATATMTLYFLQSEFDAFNTARGSYAPLPTNGSDATGKANLRITQYNGAGTTPGTYPAGSGSQINPSDASIVYNATANRWEVSFSVTGSGGFYVHTGNFVLPVALTKFKGEQAGNMHKLSWTTATETNNKGFELQRSADGTNFSSLAYVGSKAPGGNSNNSIDYGYNDVNPLAGNNYYRLKQLDKDGNFNYSNVILLTRNIPAISISRLYPNPAMSQLNLEVISPRQEKVTILVSDLTGKVAMQQKTELSAGNNLPQLNVQSLAAGNYTIRIVCANGCETTALRFVKQ